MFGVCATVKRTRSLDTPSNVTNQLQLFDDIVFDNLYNQKESFASDDNLFCFDNECCLDNTEDHPNKQSHDIVNSCHGDCMGATWRTGGIKKSVELFNSPYRVNDNSSVVMCSNKKRKVVSTFDTITMVTNTSSISTKNRPSINNYKNKVRYICSILDFTMLP